ncbi:autotransporter assembly complex protein TamA [Aquisalinus flavus]|uniref:autotransporter assembly complex protein TamA n=1 Tax=Aquisalinus flavus TaxID=1526572 RepID=UPI00165FBF72|nr:BamA/TamA family outer membrane protein [Aquisalinus flavus]MBD0427047.1 BamA/TamA family outer membrane protein [Aquisalinus flavus]UNE46873.1 BamA/TamA family outer membrane protein [Aquisalinus flavus]
MGQTRPFPRYPRLATSVVVAAALAVATPILAPAWALDFEREVIIEGLTSDDLRRELRALSNLVGTDRTYTSLASIRRTAQDDANRMQEALNSKGYYAASIAPMVVRSDDRALITFEIDRGPRFDITDYRIAYQDEITADRPQTFAEADVTTGNDPSGDALARLENRLLTWLQQNGYPAARANRHFVEANFDTGNAVAVFEITSGPEAYFGEAVVQETDRTRETFIAAYAPWEEGTLYNRDEVVDYREKLGKTGLFREISVEPGQTQPDGRTDLIVTVSERDHRTVGAGVSYATDVGPGVSLYWQNRNLLRRGETLTAQTKLSGPEQILGLTLGKPLPTLPGRFESEISFTNDITDAFDAQTLELSSSLSKTWFAEKLEASGGLGIAYSQVEDARARLSSTDRFRTATFTYAKIPFSLSWNSDNDLLNPTRGFRAGIGLTPYVGDVNFLRGTLTGATRTTLGEDNQYTLAVRGLIGSSFGVDTFDIPATERFYAGGGGSVRGFAYQEAGPLNVRGNPIGGASIIEVNTEARYNLREKIQLALFLDGGTVSDSEVPDFSEEVLWGAGIGARYLTPIGPLRVDLATPLNPRDSDDAIQFYIALGQPF